MQRHLSDYLQYEMYHVLGAYGMAERKLEELERDLRKIDPDSGQDRDERHGAQREAILKLASRARAYNAALGASRHKASGEIRHPIPTDLPLTRHERFDVDAVDVDALKTLRENPWKGPKEWSWVLDFYDTAIHVLGAGHERRDLSEEASKLAHNLVSRRDGLSSGMTEETQDIQHRLERYEMRRKGARGCLLGQQEKADESIQREPLPDPIHRVATDNLGLDPEGSLPFFVINAQAEAHLAMHGVEAWQSMSLGRYAEQVAGEGQWLESELNRCIALGTFVYCVARSAPWIFAEDEEECRRVFEHFSHCWRNVVPTRCMWLASQLSLLALHRRAYAYALKGDNEKAYNDYHKLQRQLRDMRRRIQSAPIHVEGAHAFLFGLDAQAHHHIGELYRSEHAHKPAVKHFRSASHGLELLAKDKEMHDVLVNSRWHVQLHVSHGKANYELGHHKEALCWHLRGWCEFLKLLAADTGTTANVERVTTAIKWLEEVRFEPELLKFEVQEYLKPVVEQLEGIAIIDRLGALATDILLRLGHLLFVLDIGRGVEPPGEIKILDPKNHESEEQERREAARAQISETLAFWCLRKAVECDPSSTLAGADTLKARLRFRSWFAGTLPEAYDELLMPEELDGVAHQWPGGSDDYENVSRVTEYLILRSQIYESPTEPVLEEAEIARSLLLFFFMHTDSINVRKSQVHRFLMRPRDSQGLPEQTSPPAIEFISMRRYSSAFPLLPRPSTFRALGGGYFVRLHGAETDKPFGIVIDPGIDFIENLYRTGYSLSDIDMIIVTHDHVDHLGSLDPLLSLLHEYEEVLKMQGRPQRSNDRPQLVIFANESVMNRYAKVEQLRKSNAFRHLRKFTKQPGVPGNIKGWPKEFEIMTMSSKGFDKKQGHPDLSENPAYGLCIRAADGPSITLAGDTPSPPAKSPKALHKAWCEEWQQALAADLLVCHLSTVPLTELRKLADIDATKQPLRKQDREQVHRSALTLREKTSNALKANNRAAFEPFGAGLLKIEDSAKAIESATEKRTVLLASMDDHAKKIQKGVDEIVEKLESDSPPDLPREIYDIVDGAKRLLDEITGLPHDVAQMARIRREMQASNPQLQGQVEFALWLRSYKEGRNEPPLTVDLLRKVDKDWRPPPQHPYLSGVIRWAREYKAQRETSARAGLLVVGELSEELGTLRNKVAMGLNDTVFKAPVDGNEQRYFGALTSDIGLHVLIARPASQDRAGATTEAQVLCTICNLDTDRVPTERFHTPHQIHEVCVKGENEGIFYNCKEHNPATLRDPVFLEQQERFDIFGR